MDNQPIPQPTQPTATPSLALTVPPPKKKSLLWLWITLSVVAVLAVVGVVVFILLHQGVQQTKVAIDFMTALQNADGENIKKLSGQNPDSDSVKKVIDGLKGPTYTLKDSSTKDGTETFNFTVNNSSDIHDISVTVKDGKVTSTSQNTAYDAAQKQSRDDAAKKYNCITLDDFKSNKLNYFDNIFLKSVASSDTHRGYFDNYFFETDSASYSNDSYTKEQLQKVASFYKATKTKNYSFALKGTEHKASVSDTSGSMAKQRSQNIKNDLVSLGVDAAKIVIDEPAIDDHSNASEIDRRVDLDIVIPGECAEAY